MEIDALEREKTSSDLRLENKPEMICVPRLEKRVRIWVARKMS